VKVVIQLREGATVLPERLMEFCEPRMAFFMIPRYIEFIDKLPRTESGTILKRDLRTITLKTWDREKAGYTIRRD